MFDYQTLKEYLFKLDPEKTHKIAEYAIRTVKHVPICFDFLKRKNFITNNRLKQNIFSMNFPNPVGRAAGFDKNGTMIEAMPTLGFGFVEVGTVTPKPQKGNLKPRLFRFPKEESLENSMGFNNDGMIAIQKRLRKLYPFTLPIGVNIGKNKTTPQGTATEEYLERIHAVKVVHLELLILSLSPNTPGL